MSTVDVRLSGTAEGVQACAELLEAIEAFLRDGDVTALRQMRVQVLEASRPYANRGGSKLVRSYIKLEVDRGHGKTGV